MTAPRGPMMEAFLSLEIPEQLSPPPDLNRLPEPVPAPPPVEVEVEQREMDRPRPPPVCLRNCFCVMRAIFWFNVAVLLYLSVSLAPVFLKYMQESEPHRSLDELRFSATFWYIVLIAVPIVVVYYTHNVRRWLR